MAELTLMGGGIDKADNQLFCWVSFIIYFNTWEQRHEMAYDLYASVYLHHEPIPDTRVLPLAGGGPRPHHLCLDFAARETFTVELDAEGALVLPSESLVATKYLGEISVVGSYTRDFTVVGEDGKDRNYVIRLKALPKIQAGLVESPVFRIGKSFGVRQGN